METLNYILLGFAPGLFWLWFFRRKDDLEPEPRWMLIRVFVLGCASTLPVLWLGPSLNSLIPAEPGWRRHLVDAFLVTAPLEETAKLLAFFFGAWLSRELDEPLDGIIYGIAAGLGFASVENVLYLVRLEDVSVIVVRTFTSTLGHVVFTGSLGFLLGLAKFTHGARQGALMLGALPLAIALHGLYNVFLFPGDRTLGLISLLGFLPAGLLLLGLNLRWSRARSAEYHPELAEHRQRRRRIR